MTNKATLLTTIELPEQALGDSTRALKITPKISNQFENNMDDRNSDSIADDDNTNVSELAEDRIQRAFDSVPAPRAEIHYTTSDTTGENVIDDGPLLERL